MTPYQRILVIHPNRANAKLLRNGFEAQGAKVKSIYSGIDSVPAFEQFRPDAVVADESLTDLPVEAMTQAFRQMNPEIYIFLCAPAETDELRMKCQALAVTGAIIPPFGKVNWDQAMSMAMSGFSGGEDDDSREEQTVGSYGDEARWEEFPLLASHETRDAKSFQRGERYRVHGNLKVVGSLRHVQRLDVTGALIVEGGISESKVRCGGNLRVNGLIQDCPEGVYARGDIDVVGIRKSVVVSGGNLFFGKLCRFSNITVLQRMVGRTRRSRIVGGCIRVGEHIHVAILGDHHHEFTQIKVAPPAMHKAWKLHKLRLWEILCRLRPRLSEKRLALFDKQVANPKFFQLLGEILTDKIYPAVEISVGEKDEFVFEQLEKPVRVSLGRKNRYTFGVCIRKRMERPRASEPQKNTAELD